MKKLLLILLCLPMIGLGQGWSQLGQDIDGEAANDESGYSVSLSSDGGTVAIGACYNDGNGSNAGHVRIYENINSTWVQIGQDIDGEGEGDLSGFSVSLSSDGSVVAIGALKNDGNGSASGHVRIYNNFSNPGCTDLLACNYDTEATADDGSCTYTDDICETCEDGLIVDNDSDDDGVCDADEVVGCQDMDACNYNALATDAGSCTYVDGICETCEDGIIIDNDSDDDGICDDDEIETY